MEEKNDCEYEKTVEKKVMDIKNRLLKEVFLSKVWSFKKINYLCTRISTETDLQS